MLRVGSALSSRFEGRGAWALRFPAYHHVKFGGVVSGAFHLWIEGDRPVRLEQGDFYLLTNGQPFCSASDPVRAPADGPAIYRNIRSDDGVVRYEGDRDDTLSHVSLASGRFTFENDVTDLLLRHLPPLIHLRAADLGSHALSRILDLLAWETDDVLPGSQIVRSSLASLALVQVLRVYLATTPQPQGWLGALSDPKIGRALALMHAQPGERWTVERLAAAVAMSRTAFAAHFRRLVGSAPLEYLGAWRMTIARAALRHSETPLQEIATRVGYLSDTAFSIAFKRSTGRSPGRYRTESRAMGCAQTAAE